MKKTEDYVRWAVQHGEATRAGSYRKANRAHDKLAAVLRTMERDDLRPLLDHESPSVRCWAATHLLGHHTEDAIAVLQKLAVEEKTAVGFGAEMVLREWKAGRLGRG